MCWLWRLISCQGQRLSEEAGKMIRHDGWLFEGQGGDGKPIRMGRRGGDGEELWAMARARLLI